MRISRTQPACVHPTLCLAQHGSLRTTRSNVRNIAVGPLVRTHVAVHGHVNGHIGADHGRGLERELGAPNQGATNRAAHTVVVRGAGVES